MEEQGYARKSSHVTASRAADVLNAKKQKTEPSSHVFAVCPQSQHDGHSLSASRTSRSPTTSEETIRYRSSTVTELEKHDVSPLPSRFKYDDRSHCSAGSVRLKTDRV